MFHLAVVIIIMMPASDNPCQNLVPCGIPTHPNLTVFLSGLFNPDLPRATHILKTWITGGQNED